MVDVVSDGKSFVTASGLVYPKGRTVVCVCMCKRGDELNENRSEDLKFPKYDPETMTLEGQQAPAKPVTTMTKRQDDGWGDLPARDPAAYGQSEEILGECEEANF